jgi:hypothetical protein
VSETESSLLGQTRSTENHFYGLLQFSVNDMTDQSSNPLHDSQAPSHNDFVESCLNSASFPINLVLTTSVQEPMSQKLGEEVEELFNEGKPLLEFKDIYPSGKICNTSDDSGGPPETLDTKVTTLNELRTHVRTDSVLDPHFRYV